MGIQENEDFLDSACRFFDSNPKVEVAIISDDEFLKSGFTYLNPIAASASGTSMPPAESDFISTQPPLQRLSQYASGTSMPLTESNFSSTQPRLFTYESGTSMPLTESNFSSTQPRLFTYGDGSSLSTGFEQYPIRREESDAKRELEAKSNSETPSKKRRNIISKHDLELQFGKTRKDAASCLNISESKLKRDAKKHNISPWPSNRPPPRKVKTEKKKEVEKIMIVKAEYNGNYIKFELSSLSKMADLQKQVSKRLNLNGGSLVIKYKDEDDEDGDLILLSCDEDLEYCVRTAKQTTIKMFVATV